MLKFNFIEFDFIATQHIERRKSQAAEPGAERAVPPTCRQRGGGANGTKCLPISQT